MAENIEELSREDLNDLTRMHSSTASLSVINRDHSACLGTESLEWRGVGNDWRSIGPRHGQL